MFIVIGNLGVGWYGGRVGECDGSLALGEGDGWRYGADVELNCVGCLRPYR